MDFRFGLVAGNARTGTEWVATARRAEELGYDTLLVPDTLHTLSPFAALAAAAAGTTTLRLGTYVLSAPNRSPGLVAWETRSLQLLSGGRFELGIGGGRPGAERDAAALGGDFGTPGERLRRVADTIRTVREGAGAPPILVAASRPGMLRLAADQADIVALGLPPQSSEDELAAMVATLGDRAGAVELHVNVAAVAETADDVPEWLSRMVGGDPREMARAGGIAFLLGGPGEIAETLLRRRAELGISYIGVSGLFMEQFAPVIDLLREAG
ncbi:LLM class flavin-dependent oxidoreductase [Amorphoplanes digitatis]|uniref:Putative F420-dependent oxidoreductase n=1 Tax=Actinoplanes digitatis TaxID=1868 RepID=A0A7W7I653_9ACTN|nr:LLM class flavin-dependent oxidoreductase [Actinoplanes digitatis]MBB4767039.1 putative F420-dependent oxidoreductase [Actinoplanes digitatis]BFE77308.1 LLM class flavin-dependent oxidoreductase [Actinoplanes digitatis]GID95596.1 oxidoreductase [Actinoplanes digitatis]